MRSNWQRVRELFERALEEQPSDLDAWLAREAAADGIDVRAEVRSLLEHDSRAGRFLTQPAAERVPSLLDEEPSYPEGHVVGHYTPESVSRASRFSCGVIERCLHKAPAERYASAVEIAAALTARESAPAQPVLRWWRTHQVIVIALYFVAFAVAWKTKESQTGAPLVIFGVIGVAATIAGVSAGTCYSPSA